MLIALLLAALTPGLELYQGRYVLVPEQSDKIAEVVERTVRQFNFLIRPIARSRLQRTQVPFPSIEFQHRADKAFVIAHENGTKVVHQRIGPSANAVAPDGTAIRVRLNAGPPLREIYESGEGQRENTYELSDDGRRLTVQVFIMSPRLREPLRYRLVYERASDRVVR